MTISKGLIEISGALDLGAWYSNHDHSECFRAENLFTPQQIRGFKLQNARNRLRKLGYLPRNYASTDPKTIFAYLEIHGTPQRTIRRLRRLHSYLIN